MKKSHKLLGLPLMLLVCMAMFSTNAYASPSVAVQTDDIMAVVNTLKSYLIVIAVAVVAMVVLLIIAGKLSKKAAGLIRVSSVVAALLVVVLVVNMIVLGPMYNTIGAATMEVGTLSDESVANSRDVIVKLAQEGIVLAKNEDNILPLADTNNINVFGWSSTNPIYGGTGSGGVDVTTAVDMLTGLADAGFTVNSELVDFYREYRDARPAVEMRDQDWTLPEPNVSRYTDAMISNAKDFSDVAVIVIARSGGEGADLPTNMDIVLDGSINIDAKYAVCAYDDTFNEGNDWDAGDHYLQLTNREEELVELVCDNFDDVIVIYNGANAIEMDWTNQYKQIKGVILCPGPGATGFEALGQIMKGEVNPSGKTVDTWVSDLTAIPIFKNVGDFRHTNTSALAEAVLAADPTSMGITSFINYVEGIYVGYKFYETAYAETQAGNMAFDYDSAVVYPFGYGLTYTSFTQEMGAITESNGVISVDVTVTNTGRVAGKDVVEVYYNPPYTNGGIEKSAVNLIAMDKTSLLEPGKSETLTLSFKVEDMASYDAKTAKAYVLEAGDYVISINSDAHTVIDSDTYTVSSTVVYGENNARSTDLVVATNQFDYARGTFTELSRANGFANYDEATAAPADSDYIMSDALLATFTGAGMYDPTKYDDPNDVMPTMGAKNGLKLYDLRGVDYDDPKWDTLLDELTFEDMQNLIGWAGFQTAAVSSIEKVVTMDADGPAGVNSFFTGTYGTGYCAAVMLAQTWNEDLAYEMGNGIAKECIDFGIDGWYGPAMNIHRSSFSGRNFEYYSEDGVLSGLIGIAEVKGACDLGLYPYLKHFAINDQETNRLAYLYTWISEQSAREIYLKPFEMTVKGNQGSPMAVMTAFNFIGEVPAQCNPELLNNILRDEWGFIGFAETDYFSGRGYQDADRMIRGGNDAMLSTATDSCLVDDRSATSVIAMRQASKNILYTVVNSIVYDNYTGMATPSWQKMLYVGDAAAVILLIAVEVLAIRSYKKKNAAGK